MLAKQQKMLETKMTLPTIGSSTIPSPQINYFNTMHCTIANAQAHQPDIQLEAQPAIKTSTSFLAGTQLSTTQQQQLAVENVMPGIYLSKNFVAWNEVNLRAHRFTHIIIIDKHIQELYYPSPVFKLCSEVKTEFYDDRFDVSTVYAGSAQLKFGKEFEAIDLNFGEKSYLTTVLPNCYRAVKFINKALQVGGTILVIDCNGGEQKCLTIIVAYLMYKNNINFNDAFSRLKSFYKKADLDRFYTSQLYEYEPILQVQRAQSHGHSCSREMHSALLKRKQIDDHHTSISESANGLFDTLNPLTQFHTHQQQQRQQQYPTTLVSAMPQVPLQQPQCIQKNASSFHDWYDYVMD